MVRRTLSAASVATGVVALLLAAPVIGQPSEDTPDSADNLDASLARTRAALIAAGNADALAAAAFLTIKAQPEARLALFSSAAAAAPTRPDLAWLELHACIQVPGCDVKAPEARLRSLDPGNGAAWDGTLERARNGDPVQLKGALQAIGGASRFDTYWNAIIFHTAHALMGTQTMPDHEAVTLATGMAAAIAIPAYQPISGACKGDLSAQPDALDLCRRLAGVLRHGDMFFSEMLGLSMTRLAWPFGSEEYRQAAASTRVNQYRMSRFSSMTSAFTSDTEARRYLELLAANRTEQEALVAELIAAGANPDPPAGWTEPRS